MKPKKQNLFFAGVIVLLLLLNGEHLQAQAIMPKAKAKLDTTAIMIGDQIGMDLSLEVPQGTKVRWPRLPDTLVPHIEIMNRGNIDTIRKENSLLLRRHLTITSFDSGYFNITPMKFPVLLPGHSKADTLTTSDLFLQVYTPKVDTTKPFKPIVGPVAEPYTLGEILPWILLALAILGGLAFLIWYLIKRKKNQPLFARKPKPQLPPAEEAIQRLEEIRLARMWQAGKLKAYHSAITDIMRNYFSRRFGIDAREMTTGEIIQKLEKEPIVNKEVLEKVKGAFELADLVKFAKVKPSPLENDTSLNYCIDFVNETKEVPPPPENGENPVTETAVTEKQEEQAEHTAPTKQTEPNKQENKEEK